MILSIFSRFIINIPNEEQDNLIRICFQIELAHWFYLDFNCSENSSLPKCSFHEFARIIFNHIPFLNSHLFQLETIIGNWKEYESSVPTYGAILLDESMESVWLICYSNIINKFCYLNIGFNGSRLLDKNRMGISKRKN